MKERHCIAVRTLVEVVLRAGDLDMRFSAPGRLLDGMRAHRAIQAQRPEGYRAEVPVSIEVERPGMVLVVSGRIDGVWETEAGVVVEEIKSTSRDLAAVVQAPDPCHWGQVKAYAFLLAKTRQLSALTVRLTYTHLDSGKCVMLDESLTDQALAVFFQNLIDRYLTWALVLSRWRRVRDAAIASLDFPFATYRSGQRDMAVAVYRTIRDGGQAIVQAPTGIGKTMAALFPALKHIGKGHIERIFFLTARNTGKAAASKALAILQQQSLRLKRICLTAKDRICFCPDAACNPELCEYARGYYDRLPGAREEAFARDNWDRETVEILARTHRVCPFEFSLELSRWADCIIGDYNYAFDPRVYLRRFFDEEGGAYAFLVDEAHNLAERSREMFSAHLGKSTFLELRRAIRPDLPELYRVAGKINTWMRKAASRTAAEGGFVADRRLPEGLAPLLHEFVRLAERWLAKNQAAPYREYLLDRYFAVTGFLRVWDVFDDSYVTCHQVTGKDLLLKLFCLDPSPQLKAALQRARSTLFFSATMTPADYFQEILGCESTAIRLAIASPFPRDHFKVVIAGGVSTYFTQRQRSLNQVVALIRTCVGVKSGNYLCFFPSFAYMSMAVDRLRATPWKVRMLVQEREMDSDQRARFLDQFEGPQRDGLVGFAVMGGIFGEGIDLVGERLCGAVIVGVGLPAICPERDLIRDYFDARGAGFDFAYRFPGVNRVLQAAGRVIRTEQDRGVLMLIDQRFEYAGYQSLLPLHWQPAVVRSSRQLEVQLRRFWQSDPDSTDG